MSSSQDVDKARAQTDDRLREERERADSERLAHGESLAEDADDLIREARERARRVLEVARQREDKHLLDAGSELRTIVQAERDTADAVLAAEHAAADAERADERERRCRALVRLLADERAATDAVLGDERVEHDRRLAAREDLMEHVTHDLRTVVSAVSMNSSVIQIAPDIATARSAADGIQRATAHIVALLETLVDVAALDRDTGAITKDDVELVQLARDAVAVNDEAAKARRIALAVHSAVPSLNVRVDGRRIARLLVNLIGNAIKYSDDGGSIDVELSTDRDECEISVRDTGIGISGDQLDLIFERFHRVEGVRRHVPGVGLGLYICRRIAEAHGGRIWAESTPGAGSTFRVRLPTA